MEQSLTSQARKQLRNSMFDWAANGQLKPEDVPKAFQIAGLTPGLSDWRKFIQTLLLWTGVVLIAAGVIFFFAYNWQSMHRFVKFALAQTALAAAFITAWYLGLDSPAGKAAVTAAALLTGALLALAGQIYQTGADTYELFGVWAVLILPWAIVACFAPLWLLWIGLMNLAVVLYFQTIRWGMLGVLFGASGAMWTLFAFNSAALAIWETGFARRVSWLSRWAARVLVVLAGFFATAIGILSAVGSHEVPEGAFLMYAAWMAAVYFVYRRLVFDVFMLAGAALSAITVITAFLSKHLLEHADAGGFLLIGLVVVGLSGAAAWWIRQLLQEERPA